MWIEKVKCGYKFCDRYTDKYTGKMKKVSVTLPGKSLTYQMQAATILDEKMHAARPIGDKMTFAELISDYLEAQKHVVKAQTVNAAEMHLRTISKTIGGDVLINKLDAIYVNDRFRKADLTPTTYNGQLKYFKALMRWAYQNDRVKDISYLNKIVRAKDPEKKAKLNEKYMEPDELAALLNGMKSERWKLLTRFLVLSGLRIGEAMALTWDDVQGDYISVTKTYAVNLKALSTVKTETSERLVYIQDELRDVIDEVREHTKILLEDTNITTNLLFPNKDGGYICYEAYAKYMRENTLAIIGRPLSPHALRHTHTSLMAAAGLTLEQISRRLGHADSAITREVYFHVTKKLREQDNAAIKGIRLL